MTRFEFKIVSGTQRPLNFVGNRVGWDAFERQLNDLATDGWALVSVSTATGGSFVFGIGALVPMATALFRRPLAS